MEAGTVCAVCARWPWALCLLVAASCSSETEDTRGPLPDDEFDDAVMGRIEPRGGFLDGRRVEFYQLGEIDVRSNRNGEPSDAEVNPLYVFKSGGSWQLPSAASGAGQRPIIDVIPGQGGFAPFWEIYEVSGGAAAANDIKSRATLLRSGLEITPTGFVVNCPLISADAQVVPPAIGASVARPTIRLWYRRFETQCLLLDGGEALVGGGATAFEVASVSVGERVFRSVPIHEAFVPRLFLFDEEIDVPGNIIITAGLGPATPYSPLVRVFDIRVPPDYDFCAFDRLGDVDTSLIEIRDPLTFWNLSLLGAPSGDGGCGN